MILRVSFALRTGRKQMQLLLFGGSDHVDANISEFGWLFLAESAAVALHLLKLLEKEG